MNERRIELSVNPGVAETPVAPPAIGPGLQKSPAAPRRYLVFTSAGNRNAVPGWLAADRDFDLWVVWYANGPDILDSCADYYLRRAGSKFQNLHYCYHRWPDLFERYEAIMVMDDDIRLASSKIDRLFKLRSQHDLWALQPAFSPLGKLSHAITRVKRANQMRFTDFIEMTCPLFRTDKLIDFLDVYDPRLVGWGCDWWFLHSMGSDLRGRVAVIDSIVCTNPRDSWKQGGFREIDRLQSTEKRRETWEQIREANHIDNEVRGQNEFTTIVRSGWTRWAMLLIGQLEWLSVVAARSVVHGISGLLERHRRHPTQ